MDICDECGKQITTSFKCSYCNGTFCKKHAHIDNHNCPYSKRGSYKKIKTLKNKIAQEKLEPTIGSPSKKGELVIITIVILIGIFASWNLSYNLGHTSGYALGYDLGTSQGESIGFDLGYPDGYYSGNITGYNEGYEIGYENGIYIGQNDGYREGYSVAHDTGLQDGNQTAFNTSMTQGLIDIEDHAFNLSYPNYNEVKSFLRRDKTDRADYLLGSFKCSDFAQTIKTNAAKEGIHCYYVSIDFPEPPGHAIIAFNTTDKGLLFFEPQSDKKMEVDIGVKYWRDNIDRARPEHDDTIIQYELIW